MTQLITEVNWSFGIRLKNQKKNQSNLRVGNREAEGKGHSIGSDGPKNRGIGKETRAGRETRAKTCSFLI